VAPGGHNTEYLRNSGLMIEERGRKVYLLGRRRKDRERKVSVTVWVVGVLRGEKKGTGRGLWVWKKRGKKFLRLPWGGEGSFKRKHD